MERRGAEAPKECVQRDYVISSKMVGIGIIKKLLGEHAARAIQYVAPLRWSLMDEKGVLSEKGINWN